MIHRGSISIAEPRLIPQKDLLAVIGAVLKIATRAWARIRRDKLLNDEHRVTETLTAGLLYLHMLRAERERNPRSPPMKIKSEVPTFSSEDLEIADGRIDIEIIYSLEDDPDLRLECKRVSATPDDDPKRQARYYVNGGVLRFVGNKYGHGRRWGVMVAFVIDGLFESAAELIREYVAGDTGDYGQERSCLTKAWQPEDSLEPHRHLFSTEHRQGEGSQTIRLLHLFLPFPRRQHI